MTNISTERLEEMRRGLVFEFDRYINGELMAEGVTVNQQPDVASAMRAASRMAARGANGEVPVLILRPLDKSGAVNPQWETHKSEGAMTVHSISVDGVLCRWWGDHEPDGVSALIDAYRSSNKGEVAIKPLEWLSDNFGHMAESILGVYWVRNPYSNGQVELQGPHERRFYRSQDEAKAAAQADFDTRIRSALVSQSSPKGVEITDQPARNYLVWSNEHRAWWRENSQGYARSILEAGRYTRDDAVDIADKSRNGWELDRRPDEIAVAIADLPPPIRAALEAAMKEA